MIAYKIGFVFIVFHEPGVSLALLRPVFPGIGTIMQKLEYSYN